MLQPVPCEGVCALLVVFRRNSLHFYIVIVPYLSKFGRGCIGCTGQKLNRIVSEFLVHISMCPVGILIIFVSLFFGGRVIFSWFEIWVLRVFPGLRGMIVFVYPLDYLLE